PRGMNRASWMVNAPMNTPSVEVGRLRDVTPPPIDRLLPDGAMGGVRGLLLDLDGVLIVRNTALPSAVAALAELRRRGVPFRVMTNTSSMSRATLADWSARAGIDVPPDHIVS